MKKNIQLFLNGLLEKVSLLSNKVPKRALKKHVRTYIHAVKPPYKKEDMPHLLGTSIVIGILVVFFLLHLNKHTFASNGILPTKPQIVIGGHAPFTHAEQGSIHMVWLPSTDSLGIAGYRVYRNGVKLGETTTTSYDDSGVSGNLTYTIVAVDQAGSTASSSLHIMLPKEWTPQASSANAVVSGFVLDKSTNMPLKNALISLNGGMIVHTDHNGYFYLIFPTDSANSIQLHLQVKGYQDFSHSVNLQKGQSVSTVLHLTPQETSTSFANSILKFFHWHF